MKRHDIKILKNKNYAQIFIDEKEIEGVVSYKVINSLNSEGESEVKVLIELIDFKKLTIKDNTSILI